MKSLVVMGNGCAVYMQNYSEKLFVLVFGTNALLVFLLLAANSEELFVLVFGTNALLVSLLLAANSEINWCTDN